MKCAPSFTIPETKVRVKRWNRDILPKKRIYFFFFKATFSFALVNLLFERLFSNLRAGNGTFKINLI